MFIEFTSAVCNQNFVERDTYNLLQRQIYWCHNYVRYIDFTYLYPFYRTFLIKFNKLYYEYDICHALVYLCICHYISLVLNSVDCNVCNVTYECILNVWRSVCNINW